jgi:glycerate dehydrogenase
MNLLVQNNKFIYSTQLIDVIGIIHGSAKFKDHGMLNTVLLDTNKISNELKTSLEHKLKAIGVRLTSYNCLSTPNEIKEHCSELEFILVNKVHLNEDHFKLLPQLKYIFVIATGYDNVDVVAARRYDIAVINVPDYSTQTVAQHTLALLLELTSNVGYSNQLLKHHNQWFNHPQMLELSGLVCGIIGFGQIAQAVIKLMLALGMQVQVLGRTGKSYQTNLPVKFVDKYTLFSQSDVISLNCSLNVDTKEIINKETLRLMKPTSLLINTARGGLINEFDLAASLKARKIKGAALDVFQTEPLPLNSPLLNLDNCILTPHIAWLSNTSLIRLVESVATNIQACLQRDLINVVNS